MFSIRINQLGAIGALDEFSTLETLREILNEHNKAVVDRTLRYLQQWNDKRPARDD